MGMCRSYNLEQKTIFFDIEGASHFEAANDGKGWARKLVQTVLVALNLKAHDFVVEISLN